VLTIERERERKTGMGKGRPGNAKGGGYSSERGKGCVM
jgi:hypothetical protein